MSMTTDRRPRIRSDIAEAIDNLRDGLPFEYYINQVLERHVHANVDTERFAYERDRGTQRLHTFEDFEGRLLYVDTPGVDAETRSDGKVKAMFVCADEEFDPVCCFVDDNELRALRDLITDILGELA